MTKLYRSTTDKRIAGVCGGISEISNIDSTLIRLLFFASFFSPFPTVIFYLACWIIVPKNPGYKNN